MTFSIDSIENIHLLRMCKFVHNFAMAKRQLNFGNVNNNSCDISDDEVATESENIETGSIKQFFNMNEKNAVYVYNSIFCKFCLTTNTISLFIRCSLCDKCLFKSMTSMRRHISSFHHELMPNVCPPRKRKRHGPNRVSNISIIRRHIVELVTVHGRPLKILNDAPMKSILQMALTKQNVSFTIPKLREDIHTIAADVKQTIKDEMREKTVSLMLDIVTKYNRSYLGVNVQYIYNNKLVVRTIGMLNMEQAHSGKYISELVGRLTCEYGLSADQIYAGTSDNARNVVNSIKKLHETIGRLMNEQNVSLASNSDEEAIETEMVANMDIIDDVDFEELSNILNADASEEVYEVQNFDNIDGMQNAPCASAKIIADAIELLKAKNANITIEDLACAAHTLQLAIVDAFKEWNDIDQLVPRCVEIVKALRTPNIRRIMKERKLNAPSLNVVTRWNSMYTMVILYFSIYEYRDDTFIEISDGKRGAYTSVH